MPTCSNEKRRILNRTTFIINLEHFLNYLCMVDVKFHSLYVAIWKRCIFENANIIPGGL